MYKAKSEISLWEEVHSESRRICMLMITHACNLNCSYCYESHKGARFMTIDKAKQIIIDEAVMVANSSEYDELQIDFMGGEPLMNFSLIKNIVEWLETDVIPVPWICFATTNATLLDDERKEWFKEHSASICLGASYDGTGNMQSTNRGTSKYDIDLDFFHSTWPFEHFQMTISKETLPNLAEGVLYVQRKGYGLHASLAQGVDWDINDAILYRQQLSILKDAYLKDNSLPPLNRLTRFVDVFSEPPTEKRQTIDCGSGHNMVTYDINGKTYGCHMFSTVVLGDNAIGTNDIEWNDPELMVDDYCESCVLRRFCPTCPGFNFRYRGSLAKRDKRWCSLVLAEAITACEFQIERIAIIDDLSEKDAQHAQSAINAYHILKHFDLEKSLSPYIL